MRCRGFAEPDCRMAPTSRWEAKMARIASRHDEKEQRNQLIVPFACRDGAHVSVTISPKPGSRTPEDAIADAKEVVRQLAATFARDKRRPRAVPPVRAADAQDDAVFRSWAFDR